MGSTTSDGDEEALRLTGFFLEALDLGGAALLGDGPFGGGRAPKDEDSSRLDRNASMPSRLGVS